MRHKILIYLGLVLMAVSTFVMAVSADFIFHVPELIWSQGVADYFMMNGEITYFGLIIGIVGGLFVFIAGRASEPGLIWRLLIGLVGLAYCFIVFLTQIFIAFKESAYPSQYQSSVWVLLPIAFFIAPGVLSIIAAILTGRKISKK
jgi:hypothetical protein